MTASPFDAGDARAALIEGLGRHGLEVGSAAVDRLAAWLVLLARHNRRANLVGPMGLGRLVDEIVCDSLQGLDLLPAEGRMLDVGSGAGVPGTPLACAALGLHTTWLEPRQKRATFLDVARRSIGLEGQVIGQRLDVLDVDVRFDALVSRAVFAPDRWLCEAMQYVRPGGSVLVWVNEGALPDAPDGLSLDGQVDYRLADGRERSVARFVAAVV